MTAASNASFGDRLRTAIDERGHLCVGIDPHPFLLERWNLADSGQGAREFGLRVVDAAAGRVGIVKPQNAFFERFGAAGYAALEDVLAAARAAGLLVIADVKRGDVGTSVEAYGQAWLTPGSPLESDAMTISAFQGVGSIAAPMDLALSSGKGLFVLAATSNPEAARIQLARTYRGTDQDQAEQSPATPTAPPTETPTVARVIIEDVMNYNAKQARGSHGAQGAVGSIGVVLGATLDLVDYGIDVAVPPQPGLPVLAPGFGHQGARVADAPRIYGALLANAVISDSRGLLSAGPNGIAVAIDNRNAELSAVAELGRTVG
jgi:orotidine-5'-phosphate decarboxylase